MIKGETEVVGSERSFRRIADSIAKIRALKESPPASLAETVAALEPVVREIRSVVGEEIGLVIGGFQGDRVGDLEAKKLVARSVMSLLDDVGCRLKCPRTGQPARLVARSQGMRDGGFSLEIPGQTTPTLSSATFPGGEVVPEIPNRKFHSRAR
jgi:hypothetical protein